MGTLGGLTHPEWPDKATSTLGVVVNHPKRHFSTGAVRDVAEGKGRFDLFPPHAMILLAKHFEEGGKKYEDRNWEKGIDLGTFLDSGLRHTFRFMAGHSDEDHLVAALWNFACALETRERIKLGVLPAKLGTLPSEYLCGMQKAPQPSESAQMSFVFSEGPGPSQAETPVESIPLSASP